MSWRCQALVQYIYHTFHQPYQTVAGQLVPITKLKNKKTKHSKRYEVNSDQIQFYGFMPSR